MGLISRVSSRTYRKSQKPHKYQKWLPRLNRPVGQSLKNTSSFETVSSKLNWTNSSNENWPRMDTLELLSENLKLAKSSSSPPDQVKFWEKKPDESGNCPLSLKPNLFDTNSWEV